MSTPARQTVPGVHADLERVFTLQQANQWAVKATSAEQRKEKLKKLKAAVEAHADQIMAAVKQDTRKPEGEIKVTEVLGVLGNIQKNIDSLEEWMKPVDVVPSMNPNDKARIVYEARGVCLILGPWNFPLGLTMGPLAAAIAAGNCCMVKLTDLCPATASVAGKIIRQAFDENEVALFEGGVDVATALLELPFSHIFFTGSTRVGKLVMAAAKTWRRLKGENQLPKVVAGVTFQNGVEVANTPEQFAAEIKSSVARWTPVVKAAGIKVE